MAVVHSHSPNVIRFSVTEEPLRAVSSLASVLAWGCRVIVGIIGATNVGTLRPDLLAERFELGRLLGKSLLYGADVPDNFLNCKGASVLKALTGGDPATLELKLSNERPE